MFTLWLLLWFRTRVLRTWDPTQTPGGNLAVKAGLLLALVAALGWLLLSLSRRSAPPRNRRAWATPIPVLVVGLLVAGLTQDTSDDPTIPRAGANHPNVLIVVVDTLRADRVGATGGGSKLTPSVDAFARDAVSFTQARTGSPWTKPSVTTLLTGVRL
ncbi:MAG: sulfatase-like hydrolase/transferase, partial [Planctomycetota bacterium]